MSHDQNNPNCPAQCWPACPKGKHHHAIDLCICPQGEKPEEPAEELLEKNMEAIRENQRSMNNGLVFTTPPEAETPDTRQYREDVEAGVDMHGTTDALIPKITENSNLQKQVVPDAVKGEEAWTIDQYAQAIMDIFFSNGATVRRQDYDTVLAFLTSYGKEEYERGREDEAIDHQKEDLDARRAVLEEVMEEIAKERTPRPKGDDSTIQVTDWMAKDDALDSIASVVKGLLDRGEKI